MENSAALLRRLNHYCARALEGAASLCQTRTHAEITPEHWLLKLLEQGEGDLTVLGRRYDWDMDAIWQSLLGWLDNQPRSVRSRPQLAQSLNALLKQAWMMASLQGEQHIRSVHLLGALTENPHLVRCDGLWPLLTLSQSQLQRLSPLLDAQSDECPETLQDAEPVLPQGDNVTFIGRPVGADTAGIPSGDLPPVLQGALDKFTRDITASAREGKIDPVSGRDTEIRQMVDILSRRRKNNPILVGDPGVGKTALVEGLALRIAEGNVPESLSPVTLRTLDLGLLQAGAGVKGEFEQRLKNVIDAVQQSPAPVLLFIDEAHTLIGAGNQAGGADAANLLKPALLARFQTVIYRPLTPSAMRTIVEMKLAQVCERLHCHYGLSTSVDEGLYDALTSACLLPDTGARNVESLLNQQLLPVLSRQLLSHMAAKQKPQALTLAWSDEDGIVMVFDAQAEGEPPCAVS
ncbi:TPA: AAA family ATPase [Escherichia coli]